MTSVEKVIDECCHIFLWLHIHFNIFYFIYLYFLNTYSFCLQRDIHIYTCTNTQIIHIQIAHANSRHTYSDTNTSCTGLWVYSTNTCLKLFFHLLFYGEKITHNCAVLGGIDPHFTFKFVHCRNFVLHDRE